MTVGKNSLARIEVRTKLVPPDGGWGWVVLSGIALSNIFNQSMLSLFSLLYGDHLETMGYQTKGAAVVLSTMLFVTNFGGPIAGALVKLFSPRYVAVGGAISCTLGIFLSGFATNIWHLTLTYGVLLGMGLGFIQNSSFVAINGYFTSKKSRAVGLANVGTGVGQTLMPHLVTYLLNHYGYQGACLVLSGLSLHGIAGTMLLQPVQWHMKKEIVQCVVDENLQLLDSKHKNIVISKNFEANGKNYNGIRRSTEPNLNRKEIANGWTDKKALSHKDLHASKQRAIENGNNNNVVLPLPQEKTLLQKICDLFDISLLSSPRFLNILLGTALSLTSIQNFSMIFPLYLQKVADMDKKQTAYCMSALSGADILGRLVLPTIQDLYKIKARWMLIMTSIWLIITRQILAYQTGMNSLLALSALYGFGRSMVVVARNLAISENCRMEQVPAAVGLGMLTMGIIVPPAGYLLGWVRDYTDSYVACISAQNLLLVVLLITWVPDMLILHIQERKAKKRDVEQLQLS